MTLKTSGRPERVAQGERRVQKRHLMSEDGPIGRATMQPSIWSESDPLQTFARLAALPTTRSLGRTLGYLVRCFAYGVTPACPGGQSE
jgi:hypothetical protein